jgi:hypothetical protein
VEPDLQVSLLNRLGRDEALTKLIEGRTAVQAGRAMAQQARELGSTRSPTPTVPGTAWTSTPAWRCAPSRRTPTTGRSSRARSPRDCKFFEIIDGPDCGLSYHDDPQIADGLIVDADTSQTYKISHPNCRRSFGPRPDVGSKEQAEKASRSTSRGAREDQIQFDRERGLPVRASAERAASRQSRGPIQRPSKATQPHRTSKAAAANTPGPLEINPSASGRYAQRSGDRHTIRGTAEEREALFQYTEPFTHYDINQPLRQGGTPHALTDRLDSITMQNRAGEANKLYRGIENEELRQQIASAQPGTRIVDRGFTSASASREITEDFISEARDSVLMEIRTPPGTRGVFIGNEFEGRMGFYDQSEFLFARGTEFEINSTRLDKRRSAPRGRDRHAPEGRRMSEKPHDNRDRFLWEPGDIVIIPPPPPEKPPEVSSQP